MAVPEHFRDILGTRRDTELARASRDVRLENRTNRLKLESGKRYYTSITSGLSLTYRRTGKGFGVWYCRIKSDAGADRMVSVGAADDYQDADGEKVLTYSQAQEKCRLIAKESNSTVIGKPAAVSEATRHYLDWYRVHRRAMRATESTINTHILPVWGDTLLMDLKAKDIRRWHEKLAAQPARKRTSKRATKPAFREAPANADEKRARKSTANRILTVFKAIMNRAFRDELVSDDTAWRRVKPFENADEPVTRFLTTDESIRLINSCPQDFRQLVKAALFTGARYGELARLKVAEVNIDTRMIAISPEAKSGKKRFIPLSDEGLDFFQSAIVGKTGSAHVFERGDGRPWGVNHQIRLIKEACEIAHIEPTISFHELRHTYASLLAQAGADLLTISKLLGHADTRITSRHYAHLCDKTLANAVRTMLPSFGHQSGAKVVTIHGRKA